MTFPIFTDMRREQLRRHEILHAHRKACPVCGNLSIAETEAFCTVGQMLVDDIVNPIHALAIGPTSRWWRFCSWLGRALARAI